MTVSEAMALAQRHIQAGSLDQAAAIFRSILQSLPNHAAALFHLGGVCRDMGLFPEAIVYYKRLAAIAPENADVHYQLGMTAHRMGNVAQAAAAYRQALRLRPGDAEAHNNLGVALKSQGKLDEAMACYQQALRCQPNYPEAHNNLGVALREKGKVEEAVASYQQAVALKPGYAQAHGNLGNALRQMGRGTEALAAYDHALRLMPNYADAYYNRGAMLLDLGRLAEAEAAIRQALRLRPNFPEALNNLGNALQQQSRWQEAAAAYREALGIKVDFPEAAYNLGNVLRDLGDVQDATESYRQALRLRTDYAEVHNNLANLLQEQGDAPQAVVHAQETLRLRPDWASSLFTLAELAVHGHYQFPDELVRRIGVLLDDPNLPLRDASQLHFALALLRDKAGAHDDAFISYARGNALKRRELMESGQSFDAKAHSQAVDELIAIFDSAFFERTRGFGLETELPLFIVGMPRSGTSLVEQILASHPQVFGAGELRDVGQLIDQLPARLGASEGYPRCMARLDANNARALAEVYRQPLARRGGGALRVTDKAIQHFLHVGLLTVLFPRARIIHCRRDARDVCVSCFMQYFRDLNFTWDLQDLGSYYRDYQRLMNHWRAVLPVKPLEIVYEELVADQESKSRQMIEFCGLPWDDRCLAFHNNRRPVQTMSKMQVRQPIYTSSVGRWKRYEKHLKPLLEALGET